jgi:hypothetical protein
MQLTLGGFLYHLATVHTKFITANDDNKVQQAKWWLTTTNYRDIKQLNQSKTWRISVISIINHPITRGVWLLVLQCATVSSFQAVFRFPSADFHQRSEHVDTITPVLLRLRQRQIILK